MQRFLSPVSQFVCRASVTSYIPKQHICLISWRRSFSSDSSDARSPPVSKPPSSSVPPRPRPSFEPPLSQMVKPAFPNVQNQAGPKEPPPTYDQGLLEALGITHVNPEKIAAVLREEQVTLEELKMMVDMGMHTVTDTTFLSENAPKPNPLDADEFDPSMIQQLNPRRVFYPGQTYKPEDLSPLTKIDHQKLREEQMKKGCPLGGKKGPKIDFANVGLLSRFLTDGGRMMNRRKTRVCAKKQRELSRSIKRARVMNLLPYLHKLPEYTRRDVPRFGPTY